MGAFGLMDETTVGLVRKVLADGKVVIVDSEGVPTWEGYLDTEAFKWDAGVGAVCLVPTQGYRKLVKARAVCGPFLARVYMFNGARFDKDGIPVEGVRHEMFNLAAEGTKLVGEWVDGENVGFGIYIGFR